MVGHVMRFMLRVLGACALGLALPSWALGPMAPFVAPDAAHAAAQLEHGAAQGAGGAVAAAQGLTGVRVGRHAGAVIDGQWVRKGRTARGARLVQVQRTRVVLKHPDGRKEVIEMYPPVGGQAVAAAPASTEALKP